MILVRIHRLTVAIWSAVTVAICVLPAIPRSRAEPAPTTQPISPELHVGSLHNVHALTLNLLCGSGPETDADFAALAERGIRTIISVDGSKPLVDLAERHGLRYVHLPFGYDGIPHQRELEIARAVRDLPGPIYIHCHHGQHRGPAAAAVAEMAVEGWSSQQGLEVLRVFGTSQHYKGLFQCVEQFRPPTRQELDQADASFPRIAKLNDLSEVMVEIDHYWDMLKAARDVRWAPPTDHPDLDPAHEALMLRELLREAHRPGGAAQGGPADLLSRLANQEQNVQSLELALRAHDNNAATVAAKLVETSCTDCHARYRDLKQN